MEQRILKQDGYLDVGDDSSNDGVLPGGAPVFEIRNIVYHPQLNVLLAFGVNNLVKVLDVNSGVTLQTYQLSTNGKQRKHQNAPAAAVAHYMHTYIDVYMFRKIDHTDAQVIPHTHTVTHAQTSIYCIVFCKCCVCVRLTSIYIYSNICVRKYICMYRFVCVVVCSLDKRLVYALRIPSN